MKKNTDDFKNEVKKLVGSEYTVLGEYINSKIKIKMKHNICENEYEVKPNNFLNGTRCPKCYGATKYTDEVFAKKVKELVGDEYIVLGEYKNNKTKIKMKHNICGYEFEMRPYSFIIGQRCPLCSHRVPYSTQSFKEKVKLLVGNEYTVLGNYINSQAKIKMKHNICGHEYDVVANSFLQGIRCPKCGGTLKYTSENFKNKIQELVGNEYIVLGEYKNNKTKIKMKHNICGIEYDVKPNAFINGDRCPNCAKNKKYTEESFIVKVKELVGEEYLVLGNYINSQTKIKMKHNICGHEYEVKPNSFISGHRCPKCYKTIPYTTETFKEKVKELVGDKYSVVEEYINSDTKIKMKHNICGNEYKVRPSLFIRGNRCPICSLQLRRSLPEEIIAYFVSKYFKIYQSYRPDWLKLKSGINAEIDIWIPNKKIGIEYDGGIHRLDESFKKDMYKNDIITKSNECKKLYRIRENITYPMNEVSDKIQIIKANKTISMTSKRGIDELEKIITLLLVNLGINNPNVKITERIINECQCKIEDYYESIELPVRKKYISSRKSNTREFKQRVFSLVGNEYSVLGEYVNAITKIKIRHEKCNYEYEVKPSCFLNGNRCPKCAGHLKYTTETFKEKIKELVEDEYSVLGKYINSKTKIKMRHNTCNHIWNVKPNAFIRGSRCPNCYKQNFSKKKNIN